MYNITPSGTRRLEHGGDGHRCSPREFAVWMIAWTTYRIPMCTIHDFVSHAEETFSFPDQAAETLAAAKLIIRNPTAVIRQAMRLGWITLHK